MEGSTTDREQGEGVLDRLLFDLVTQRGAQVEARGDAAAIVRLGPWTGALVRYLPGQDEQLRARLAELMTQLSQRTRAELVLIGGPAEVRKLLADSRPVGLRKQVLLYHRADDGSLWDPNGLTLAARPLGKHLKKQPLTGPSTQEEREQFAARLVEMQQHSAENARELHAFAERMGSRRPVATWALATAIAVAFALQWFFGGVDSSPVLARMGALMPDKVQQGEWWRLLASSFLHGGLAHFCLNTWVLVMVGGSLERILGSARFLAIYGLSALGASLVSLIASDASLTVGASGGIWGLLAAEAVLVWRPRGLLPEVVQQSARQNVIVNVVINVANSFRPNVAMAAHFGGGAVGALLLLGGFFLRGLPTLAQLQAGAPEARRAEPRWLRPLGVASAAALLLSLVAGISAGRAWELKSPPLLERRALPGLGLSAELPVGLDPMPLESDPQSEVRSALFGGMLQASVVGIHVARFPPIPAEQLQDEIAQLVDDLGKPPEAANQSKSEQVTIAGRPGAVVRYTYANGVEEERALVLHLDRLWRVDVACPPGLTARCSGLARQIAGSLKQEQEP